MFSNPHTPVSTILFANSSCGAIQERKQNVLISFPSSLVMVRSTMNLVAVGSMESRLRQLQLSRGCNLTRVGLTLCQPNCWLSEPSQTLTSTGRFTYPF